MAFRFSAEEEETRMTLSIAIDKMFKNYRSGKQSESHALDVFNKEELLKILGKEKLDFKRLRKYLDESNNRLAIAYPKSDYDPTPVCSQYNDVDDIKDAERRKPLIKKIENITYTILADIERKIAPKFVLRNQKLWSNIQFEERVVMKPESECQMTIVRSDCKQSEKKFSLMLYLLSVINYMLISKVTYTRRELFYQSVRCVKSQSEIDNAINAICCLLDAPQWELGLIITSSGLVAGPLEITTCDGRTLDCLNSGGVLIPNNIIGIKSIKSSAKFILVVEKDAAFQRLLDEDILKKLYPCILITGKGYPDINTRLLLKMLVDKLKIPALALVDGDPHGIEIMCVYKYGSLAMAHLGDKLVVPSLRWLGIFPSDIRKYGSPAIEFTQKDIKKCNDLLLRPYCTPGSQLYQQIGVLLYHQEKIEMEGIASLSLNYITDVYLPYKICIQDFI